MGPAERESARLAILHQMGSITRMRRGTVNAQSFRKRRQDGSLVTHGPYYLYSRTEQRRSYSERLPAEAVAQYQTETDLDFAPVDSLGKIRVSDADLEAFLEQGGLADWGKSR